MEMPELEPSLTSTAPLPPDLAAPPIADEDEPELEASPCKTMPRSEALERLARGETLRNVRIERLVFQGPIAHPVRMNNVRLVQPVFEKASFAEEVALRNCTIDRPHFNRKVVFEQGLTLAGSTLLRAIVRNLDVRGPFCGDNLRARGKFVVANCRFAAKARFWESRFEGWVDLKDCRFEAEADFRSLHAEEGFVLARCRFAGDFLFRGSTVHKKMEATGSRFEALLDLSKAKLHDFVYLEGIEQGAGQRFAFQNALAERVLVRTDQLEGRLASEEAGDFARAMQEYATLKRGFEALHRYEQEDWAFYRFKVNQRRCCNRSWRRPWTKLAEFCDWLFLDWGCGYGTSPFRAVRASLAIMIVFAAIYMIGLGSLYVERTPFEGVPTSAANRVLIGLTTSVAAFTSGFGDLRDTAKGWMNVPLIAESLLGTLLWGLFIVAFSRKVIR